MGWPLLAGHFAVGLLAKVLRPKTPILALAGAAYSPDIIEGALIIAGVGTWSDLLSHSVPAVPLIAGAIALIYFLAARRDAGDAALLAAVSLSHVVLDHITGRKPSWAGGPEDRPGSLRHSPLGCGD